MDVTQWILIYLAVGAAWLAFAWHRRVEATTMEAAQRVRSLGVSKAVISAIIVLGIVFIVWPLWPTTIPGTVSDEIHKKRNR